MWFAGGADDEIQILHAHDAAEDGGSEQLMQHARERLLDSGAVTATEHVTGGPFVEAAKRLDRDLVVMGKRGFGSASKHHSLGSNVVPMLRGVAVPVCFTSKLFLPIAKAVALLDADRSHQQAVTFVATHPSLQHLEIDVVVAAPEGIDPSLKLEWARTTLGARRGDTFALRAEGPDEAAARVLEEHGADLIIISREVLLPHPQESLDSIERRGVWGWRTPILVC